MALDIRKIYASPELLARYNDLVTEIRSLDSGIPIPPPVHMTALTELKRILADLQVAEA